MAFLSRLIRKTCHRRQPCVPAALGPPCYVPSQAAALQGSWRARSRSDNYAAVLRLQRTQPKDRRIYTALSGILAVRQPATAHNRTGQEPQGHKADDNASPESYEINN